MARTSSGGMGLTTPLTVLFVALKLTGVIAWSWVWVLSPLWISFLIGLILLATFGLVVAKSGSRMAREMRADLKSFRGTLR